MPCPACGPISNAGEMDMYKALEKKVLADEAERKDRERERRISLGLPAEKKRNVLKRMFGSKREVVA